MTKGLPAIVLIVRNKPVQFAKYLRATSKVRPILHVHTCDIFFEPDWEIWDFSEGDWGLR